MSDQRSQDRNRKLIDSYPDYKLQLHFILLEALIKPLSFGHQKKSKSINTVQNNPYLGNCLETSYFTGSRGDVFVVRTSKPVEIMGYFGRVDDRVTVSLQILYTANQETEGSQDRLTV